MTPLLDGLASPDTLVRRVAVRGLGRLQRADLGRHLLLALTDPLAGVRAEAANALAQSLRTVRRGAAQPDSSLLSVGAARQALLVALAAAQDAAAGDAMAEALGRLPYADTADARPAVEAITSRARQAPGYGAVHGLYTLALTRRFVGSPPAATIAVLRQLARAGSDPAVRRLAVLTLAVAGALDRPTTLHAARDPDDQVRRLALRGMPSLDSADRSAAIRRALRDTSAIVRIDAIGAVRSGSSAPDCSAIVAATRDPHPYVALVAIDSLGAPCRDPGAAAGALARIVTANRVGLADHAWQAPAHALVALARVAPATAATLTPRAARAARWQERAYAARAATAMADTSSFTRWPPTPMRRAGGRGRGPRAAAPPRGRQRVRQSARHAWPSGGSRRGNGSGRNSHTSGALPAALDALDRRAHEK